MKKTATVHPNTADILLEDPDGYTLLVCGESIGGGKMQIVRINQIEGVYRGIQYVDSRAEDVRRDHAYFMSERI